MWLAKQRDNLMAMYSKKEISRQRYLQQMGSVSLRTNRQTGRLVITDEERGGDRDQTQDSMLQDLEETRPLTDSDSEPEMEDPFPVRVPKRRAYIAPLHKARRAAPKCLQCSVGFQLRRNLHVLCAECGGHVHKRCIPREKHDYFVCEKCSPPPPTASSVNDDYTG